MGTLTSNTISPHSRISESNYVGEIHAITFDDDNNMVAANETLFELYGTQDIGGTVRLSKLHRVQLTFTTMKSSTAPGTYQYITSVMDDDISQWNPMTLTASLASGKIYENRCSPIDLNTTDANTNDYAFTFRQGDTATAILSATGDTSLTDVDSTSSTRSA